jgi:putative ABC transport system permease protein
MFTKENFNYALRNLWSRKTRSFLTILSIFIGITTIFIFVSFGLGLYSYINELSEELGVDKLIINPVGSGAPGMDSAFSLGDSDLNAVKRTRGIVSAAGMSAASGMILRENKVVYQFLAGIPTKDREEYNLVREFFGSYDIIAGRWLQDGDDSRVMLGYSYTLPNRIFQRPLKVGDKININNVDFSVIGFLSEVSNPADDAQIYMTSDGLNNLVNPGNEINYGWIIAKVNNVDNIDEIAERVERNLRRHRGLEEGKEDFTVASFEELIETFSAVLNIIVGFIVLIAFISIFVSAINTANTMFTSILERTKEIGVMKAIGAQNSDIAIIFLLESSMLGFIAGVIGVAIGWILSIIGANVLASLGYSFLSPSFPIWLILACVLFAMLVGTISGVLPAYNASQKKPVDSLRYE